MPVFPGVDPAALKVLDLAPRAVRRRGRETDRPMLLTCLPPSLAALPLALPEAGTGTGPAYRRGQRPCGGYWAFSQMSSGVGTGQPSGRSHFGKPRQTLRPLTFRLLLYKIQKASLHPGNAHPGA